MRSMANIASILKQEISRLARKELRKETESLQKAIASYRQQIAAMRRRIEQLERQQKRAGKAIPTTTQKDPEGDVNLRFRAEGFAQHRKRLGLSAREMGLLVDASGLTVYKWEKREAKPRPKNLKAIAAVRKMGKREAMKRLEELAGQHRV